MQHHELKLDGYKANLTVEGHRLDSLRVPSVPWHPCTNFCFFLLNINYREIKSTQLTSYLNYLLIVVFHFDPMLCSKLGSENSDAGHIKRCRGPQVPHP